MGVSADDRMKSPTEKDNTLGIFPNDFRRYLIVTGGVGKGGILVRKGEELRSPEARQRLATGSLVRAVQETVAGRLLYELLSGSGPRLGWVSVRLGEKELLRPAADEDLEAAEAAGWQRPPAKPKRAIMRPLGYVSISRSIVDIVGEDDLRQAPPARPMRVLCFCGGYSNRKVMEYQTAPLREMMQEMAQFVYIDGEFEIHDDDLAKMEPEIYAGLSKITGETLLRNWFESEFDPPLPPGWMINEHVNDMSVKENFLEFDERLERVRRFSRERGPFDIMLGFSTGCTMVTQLTNLLRKEGQQIPWHFNVLFSPMFVRDARYRHEPLSYPPCMQIFGRQDSFFDYTRKRATEEYVDPVIIEFDGGHAMPSHLSEQSEKVFQEVVQTMKHYAGFPVFTY
mmetsp:Transcript_8898/g.16855  ORF Transcript_8898/g.16855 Transcript_8898/m.16855 type:complete len:397 (-) Transcript_8898:66-1256(-)